MSSSSQSIAPSLPERLRDAALTLLGRLGPNGRPQPGEFTVLACILAEDCNLSHSSSNVTISLAPSAIIPISLATGTKCCGQELSLTAAGEALTDSHAEVLARRGLQRYLMKEALCLLQDQSVKSPLFELAEDSEERSLRLRKGIRLHMVISDSPCGDASIYECVDGGCQFTGAKVISSDLVPSASADRREVNANELWAREEDQQALSSLRLKSGRSDIGDRQRTTSLSCSDKLCRWSCLGLQGALGSLLSDKPLTLTSVVIGADPMAKVLDSGDSQCSENENKCVLQTTQLSSLYRSMARCETVCSCFSPSLAVVDFSAFTNSKCNMEFNLMKKNSSSDGRQDTGSKKSGPQKIKPCGFSLNWIKDVVTNSNSSNNSVSEDQRGCKAVAGGTVEVTIASGYRQGAVKRKAEVLEVPVVSKSGNNDDPSSESATMDNEIVNQSGDVSSILNSKVRELGPSNLSTSSRLCRARMLLQLFDILKTCKNENTPTNLRKLLQSHRSIDLASLEGNWDTLKLEAMSKPYSWWKRRCVECSTATDPYIAAREKFLRSETFRGWVTDNLGDHSLPNEDFVATSSK